MAGQIGLEPLPLTEADRLRDRIDTLKAEVQRLRGQLVSAGGVALLRVERAVALAHKWRADSAVLTATANDPATKSGVRTTYRERAARLLERADELERAVRP